MNEDHLLHKLGHLAQEDGELAPTDLDERWDRLAAGTLTAEEDAQLRALAAASPEAREAYEAFRPLGEGFETRLVERLATEIGHRAAPAEPRSRFPRLFPSRRTGWWAAAATAAAMAAGLYLALPGPGPGALPPLPSYTAELRGGEQPFRGEERPSSEPKVLAPGDRFHLELRPATRTEGKGLQSQLFLLRGGELRPLGPRRIEVDSASGAVRMEGSIDPDLEPGAWTLWAVVGRRGELPEPSDPRFLTRRNEILERDWVAVPTQIRVHSRDP